MTATEIYAACALNSTSAEHLLICLVDNAMQENDVQRYESQRNKDFSRNMALILCASLAFFMQAGFAMVCAGAVRRKNLQNTMLKNLLDACGAALAFFSVGYAFAFGDGSNPNGFIGTTNFFLNEVDDIAFWLFQFAFSAASTTIVAGTLAERCQMSAYFYFSFLLSGWVYPVTVHAIWSRHGFLNGENEKAMFGCGVLDFAGSGVVHVTGGITALVAAKILGPRRGRFHDERTGELLETPNDIKGHSIALQLLGTFILWFGWYGFNAGSAILASSEKGDILAASAAANTTLSAGAAGISTLFINYLVQHRLTGVGRYDLILTMNGVLAGLVSVTGSCGFIEPSAAIIIGALGGAFYLVGSSTLIKFRLDDAVDAIPVHLVSGIWGMLAVGLFATPERLEVAYGSSKHLGLFYSSRAGGSSVDFTLLGAQLIGIFFIMSWTAAIMIPFFYTLERTGHFRAGAVEEVMGLDKVYFGGVQMGGEGEVTDEQIAKITKKLEQNLHHRKRVEHSDQTTHLSEQDQTLQVTLGSEDSKNKTKTEIEPPSFVISDGDGSSPMAGV